MRFSTKALFALTAIAACIAWLVHEHSLNQPPDWKKYSREALEQAIQRGEIVLVSITSNQDPSFWRNERQSLSTKEQFRFLREYDVTTFRADYTFPDEEIRTLLEDSGAQWGAMIIYSPHPRDEFTVLNGEITKSRLRQAIAHARY